MVEPAAETRTVATHRSVDTSLLMLVLALLLLGASFLLISPPPGATYPSAIPWSDSSALHPLTDLMSGYGLLTSLRGVEVKDFAFHIATALALILLAVQFSRPMPALALSRPARIARYGQGLLAAWVVLSWLSVFWSEDVTLAYGQAALYALPLAWALVLGMLLERRHIVPLLVGLLIISTVGAALAIWYYYERNPYHRASFPIGNPTTLAAAILPAILLALVLCGTGCKRLLRREAGVAQLIGGLIALVPLLWCLYLTRGRAGWLALAVGVTAIVVFAAGRRVRAIVGIAFASAIVIAGGVLYYTSHLDVTMARGAAMRFRLYAWEYAATLWQANPVLGNGAGAYPRLAGTLAVRDEALDPGAFMAQLIEHAHNELFEVFVEIGLVGGVTFVGGFLATLVAATYVLGASSGRGDRWWRLALIGAFLALLADAMVGVTHRLPGVTPVFYTLVGVIWATCRNMQDQATSAADAERPKKIAPLRVAPLVVSAAFLGAIGAGWLGVSNWRAEQLELRANSTLRAGDYATALAAVDAAESGLLDPVSKLRARDVALRCRHALTAQAVQPCVPPLEQPPTKEQWRTAVDRCESTYEAARMLLRTVPALRRTDVVAAHAAQWAAELHHRAGDLAAAQQWGVLAEQSWRRQLQRTPLDVETLLELTRYSQSVPEQIALLRDALRFGENQGPWLEGLRFVASQSGFPEALAVYRAAAGPMGPETDVDGLIISMAPEINRLVAAWRMLEEDYLTAADYADRAAQLYEPLRSRFPVLYSRARAEQAEYLLRAGEEHASEAVRLLQDAIVALPTIQEAKYADMARPFRIRAGVAQLIDGQYEVAFELLDSALDGLPEDVSLCDLFNFAVNEMARLGVSRERIAEISEELGEPLPKPHESP